MMRSTMRKLIEHTTRMGHRLLRITSQANQAPGPRQNYTRVDADIWKKVGDKHAEKNFMGIGHLVPE